MNSVPWKIERSRDMLPEALKNMMKNGLESMVGAVEKVMNGVCDSMAKERKEREGEEVQREERFQKMEEKMEKEVREGEGKSKKSEERLKVSEANRIDLENEFKEMAERMEKDRKQMEKEIDCLKEIQEILEQSFMEERKVRENEERKIQERLKGVRG
jgi:hypothetical protein